MAHKDAAKFVPGSIWGNGINSWEVLPERGTHGYKVLVTGTKEPVGTTGWTEPMSTWFLIKESPRQGADAALLLSAFVAAVETLL